MAPADTDLVLWSSDAVELQGWSTSAAPGSSGRLAVESGRSVPALRFDFELVGPGAWVIARREVSAALPSNFVATLRLRGVAPPNHLQVKLVDPDGANVWWWRRREQVFPRTASQIVLRLAGLEFAWGPASGGVPGHVGAVEVAVAAGQGGSGTLWIEDLRIEPREPAAGTPRPCRVWASSSVPGHEPARVIEDDDGTSWRPEPGGIDFGAIAGREWPLPPAPAPVARGGDGPRRPRAQMPRARAIPPVQCRGSGQTPESSCPPAKRWQC